MEKFNNPDEEIKAQMEWALLNLIRELRGIATDSMPTYYNSIKLGRQLIPEVFNDKSFLVKRHHEPELVRAYRQQAEAQSKLDGKEVKPITLVDGRIEGLLKLASTDISQKDLINRELDRLKSIRSLFEPSKLSEDFILAHDVKSLKLGMKPIDIKAKYSDYKVNESKILRVRLIHPDQGEQSMGADLIYEQYDPENKKVRFIMVQYKIWDSKTLYWSQAKNLDKQLQKMSDNLCANSYCLSSNGKKSTGEFRYPYCSAFLRPTDKLQFKDSPFTSSGMHIPICKIGDVADEKEGVKKLKRSKIIETAINQKVFEECFNSNQVGSRWMDYVDAELLYTKHKILDSGERIILHAQELQI